MRPCKINLKIFCAPALKKEVGALLWQNGNETCFRETELAFLIRLFTGYLQLYPTHTKLLLALQRLRDTARAHSLLKDVFSFSIITQRPGLFSAPGIFAPSPFAGHKPVTQRTLNPLSLRAFPLRGRLSPCSDNQSAAPHHFDAGRSFFCLFYAALTRPSRSWPRATPRTWRAYGRSGGRTPSSPATTASRTR